jgi:hypothetical protein
MKNDKLVLPCDSNCNIILIITKEKVLILNTNLIIFTGMRFGLMQTKVGLVSLLSKYQISVSKKTPIPIVFDPSSFALSPKGGMWLQITKRVV